MNRREFLRLSGIGIAGTFATQLPMIHTIKAEQAIEPDIEIQLTAAQTQTQILSGNKTVTWGYLAEVIKGDQNTVQNIPDSYLGPIFRFRKGQQVRIHLNNQLPEPTITHWHGLTIPESADGHPRFVIDPDETYIYDFPIINRAGMYWYHPHPHGRTGPQVYAGLAGLLIVTDDDEEQLGLPQGNYELPMVIQDRLFDDNNQLVYLPNGMMDRMHGFLGNRIAVNGQLEFARSVEQNVYRLRLLNGSNSRMYKLAWDDGTPMTIIGTDGGLLEKPIQKDYVMLAPAERLDIWADFSGYDIGTTLALKSLKFSSTDGTSIEFPIMTFNVDSEATTSANPLPETLSDPGFLNPDDAINGGNPRQFTMSMQAMQALINGKSFEMMTVDDDEIVKAGDLEIWQFNNTGSVSGGMGMGRGMGMVMPHPMHIHNVQFQVLDRAIEPGFEEFRNTVRAGYVDEGWKDTVLCMPGESVKVLVKFPSEYTGLYLYHCHNLEHEDLGLMRNYRIDAP